MIARITPPGQMPITAVVIVLFVALRRAVLRPAGRVEVSAAS